jgi:uncharacterized membrane protein YhaH (DUF805 family)
MHLADCAAYFSRNDAVQEMILPLKPYAQFEGRANRREYWMFQLFLLLAGAAVCVIALTVALVAGLVLDADSSWMAGSRSARWHWWVRSGWPRSCR